MQSERAVQPRGSLLQDARDLVVAAWRVDRRRVSLQILFLALGGLIGGVGLLLLVPIVNVVANPGAAVTVPVLGTVNLGAVPLWALLACFVALVAAQALIQRAGLINATRVQQEIVDRLRQRAFNAVLAARWSFIVSRRRSDVIEVVTSGAARSGQAFAQMMTASVTVVIFVVTAIVAIVVAPVVSAIAIVGVLLVGLLQLRSVRPAYRLGTMMGERSRHLQSVMTDSMDSLRIIRAHDASPVWSARLADAFLGAREVQVANTRRSATSTAVSTIVLATASAVLVLLAVWAKVPPPSIVVVLLLVARMARQVQQLATTMALLAHLLPAVGDLTTLTSEAIDAAEVPPGTVARSGELAGVDPLLRLSAVTFRYPASDSGVTDLTLELPRGQITALAGHSGAGKSTTADLVLGLLSPDSGEVIVAGQALRPEDLPWWRTHVAYVPQETVLIPGTLRDNLVWSAGRDVSDEECWRALDQSAAGFARELADGLDTVLGDRGLRLSGGERQRIALARALLRQPALLVLDEATSALDDRTETAVLELIATLVPAVTVLVIAHRQSTLSAAHSVVHLDHGRVVEA